MIRIVIVEDEDLTRRALGLAMRDQGFEVHEAADSIACKALLDRLRVDAVVLDLGLPGLDGLTFAAQLRVRADIGVLVVTRREATESRIEALDLGADDYLVKPVHYGELAARIRSVVRRRSPRRDRRVRVGRLLVDLEARTAVNDGVETTLTRGEFDILARLIEANSKIVSREELLATISRNPVESDLRSVDTLVSRIRRKVCNDPETPDFIITAPGFGYRLRMPVEEIDLGTDRA
jgi:two-component system response regulator MtrA